MLDKCNVYTIFTFLQINNTTKKFLHSGLLFSPCPVTDYLSFQLVLLTERLLPQSSASLSPNVLDGVVGLGRDGHEDGLRSVLEQRCSVLSLSLLHPVAVYLEGARINELADGLDGIRVARKHLLGDRFCASVVAVDSHGGQDCHADDLSQSLRWRIHFFFFV